MSYFPILKAPYCSGNTTLYNFSPNNWELVDKCEQTVSLTYIKDDLWYSVALEKLVYQAYKVVKHNDISLDRDGVDLLRVQLLWLKILKNIWSKEKNNAN